MTAVDLDALDKLRGALRDIRSPDPRVLMTDEELADALLPVVDRIANERAAAELREAAEAPWIIARTWQESLRERAAALDPT